MSVQAVSALSVDRRAAFITRTYAHLGLAIGSFVALEVFWFQSGLAERMAQAMLSVNWLIVLGAFMIVAWLASRVAHNVESVPMQYLGLAGYVVANSILFIPLLYMANRYAPGAISSAAQITLVGTAALTFVAFRTRKDFSFLNGLLMWIGIGALITIVASFIFGFKLGTWFSAGMVVFAGAAILRDTSNIIHHFPEDRHVGAALELFSSVALMFWYVLRMFMSSRD